MAEALFRNESPTEYFRELVEAAIEHQHLAIQELTSFYVVNLLAGYTHLDGSAAADDEPLGVRLALALQTAGAAQREGLRKVGDLSLFISGFFSDSLNRSLVDVDYYIQLGERAYGSLARRGDPALGEVYDELAEKFTAVVDVLTEVSERTALTSDADVLRLYERWVRTRSRRSGELLAERGIVPNSSVRSRFIQSRSDSPSQLGRSNAVCRAGRECTTQNRQSVDKSPLFAGSQADISRAAAVPRRSREILAFRGFFPGAARPVERRGRAAPRDLAVSAVPIRRRYAGKLNCPSRRLTA